MSRQLVSILFIFLLYTVSAQQLQIVHRVNSESVELKWYSPDLIPSESVNIFRSSDSLNWIKLNNVPIQKFNYEYTSDEIKNDDELIDYKFILNKSPKIEDLMKLIMTLKSFKSTPFSKFLGIYYLDSEGLSYGNYYYKIQNLKGDLLSTSQVVSFQQNPKLFKIDSIYFEQKKKSVSFGWTPNTLHYYGVNIYRSSSIDSLGELITKDPILLSKVTDSEGKSQYPKFFFSDDKLKEKTTFYYTLVGLDFFNQNTEFSDPIKIRIKDETLPISPTDFKKTIYDRKVYLNWKKEEKEDDFKEYQILYKKPTDSTFNQLLTSTPLLFKDSSYEIEQMDLGLYYMVVAAVDEDDNHAFSNEITIEILDIIAPEIPQNLIVISDSARLIVKWSPNQESDLLGYKIYRSIEGNINNLTLLTASPFKESFFIDSLPKNALNNFSYSVVSLDTNFNESKLSQMASNAMIDITAPKQPFLKNVNSDEDKIKIEWVRNTEIDLSGYKIYRKNLKDTISEFKLINETIIPGDIQVYFDRTFEKGYEYVYHIIASDKVGNYSNPSNEYKVFIPKEKVTREISVQFARVKYSKKTNTLRLKWKYEQNFEEDDIVQKVLLRKNSDGDFKVLTYLNNEQIFTDTEIITDQTLQYQLRVYDKEGNIYRSETYTFIAPLKK